MRFGGTPLGVIFGVSSPRDTPWGRFQELQELSPRIPPYLCTQGGAAQPVGTNSTLADTMRVVVPLILVNHMGPTRILVHFEVSAPPWGTENGITVLSGRFRRQPRAGFKAQNATETIHTTITADTQYKTQTRPRTIREEHPTGQHRPDVREGYERILQFHIF